MSQTFLPALLDSLGLSMIEAMSIAAVGPFLLGAIVGLDRNIGLFATIAGVLTLLLSAQV
jgi:hypothetical protein